MEAGGTRILVVARKAALDMVRAVAGGVELAERDNYNHDPNIAPVGGSLTGAPRGARGVGSLPCAPGKKGPY